MVLDLRIDPTKVGDHQVLRIRGWEAPFIVSERLLEMLSRARVDGFTAAKVT
jgi:hypothetical protein